MIRAILQKLPSGILKAKRKAGKAKFKQDLLPLV